MPVDPLSHEYNSNQNIMSPIFAFPGHLSESITPEYSQEVNFGLSSRLEALTLQTEEILHKVGDINKRLDNMGQRVEEIEKVNSGRRAQSNVAYDFHTKLLDFKEEIKETIDRRFNNAAPRLQRIESEQMQALSENVKLRKLVEQIEAIHKGLALKLDKLDKEQQEHVDYRAFDRLRGEAAEGVAALRQDLFEFREQVAAMQCWSESAIESKVESVKESTQDREHGDQGQMEKLMRKVDQVNEGLNLFIAESSQALGSSLYGKVDDLDTRLNDRIQSFENTMAERMQHHEDRIRSARARMKSALDKRPKRSTTGSEPEPSDSGSSSSRSSEDKRRRSRNSKKGRGKVKRDT